MFTRKFVAESEDEIQKAVQNVFASMNLQVEKMSQFADNNLYFICYSQVMKILNEARANYRYLMRNGA